MSWQVHAVCDGCGVTAEAPDEGELPIGWYEAVRKVGNKNEMREYHSLECMQAYLPQHFGAALAAVKAS